MYTFISNQKNNRGFTLIEIMIVAAIFSLLSIGVITILTQTNILSSISQGRINSVDEGRKILRPLVGEVRSALPSHTGGYMLEETQEFSFIFYSDINGNGMIERVRYFIEDNTFKKGVTAPSGSPLSYDIDEEIISWIIQDIANDTIPVFEYFDASYTGTQDPLIQPVSPLDVRMVKITIYIDKQNDDEPIMLSTQVSIRNLKESI